MSTSVDFLFANCYTRIMPELFETGIRPTVDKWLLDKAQERRSYGEYWPASSGGYCMRKVIFDRLQIPYVKEDARKQRVFTAGDLFHEWLQGITRESGLSIAQELELQDETLMIRGHIDDLVLVDDKLILYDYKSQNSRAFTYMKDNKRPMSHYHKMQLGTYMLMLRKWFAPPNYFLVERGLSIDMLGESRILKISKDDLRMAEEQLLWSPELEKDIVGYWRTLNGYWNNKALPKCTCADYENSFMARSMYNPYYLKEPCSTEWAKEYLNEWKY